MPNRKTIQEDVQLTLQKARAKRTNREDADFLKWVIGSPSNVHSMDLAKSLDRVSEARATDKDLELLQSLI